MKKNNLGTLTLSILLLVGFTSAYSTDIGSPGSGEEVSMYEDYVIEWEAINTGSESKDLESSQIELTQGSDSYTGQEQVGISTNSSIFLSHTVSSQDLQSLGNGSVQLEILNNWEDDISSETLTFSIKQPSFDKPADAETKILDPGSNYTHNSTESLNVEWNSENTGGSSAELVSSKVRIEDSAGRSHTESQDINKAISPGEDYQVKQEIGRENLKEFEGDWVVSVLTLWGFADREDQVEIEVSYNSDTSPEESTDDGGSDEPGLIIGDDSSTDDSSGSTSNSTDNSTESDTGDSTNDSDNDDSTDDSNISSTDSGETDSKSPDPNCPGGFSYDSDREVCVEDSESVGTGSSDSSSSEVSGSGSSDDPSSSSTGSLLEQEVAGGITAQSIGLVALILLLGVIMFWKSDYRLAI